LIIVITIFFLLVLIDACDFVACLFILALLGRPCLLGMTGAKLNKLSDTLQCLMQGSVEILGLYRQKKAR
jgi:hypothetical protein